MRGVSSVVSFCLVAVVAVVAENQHQKELREHYDHLAYIAEFNCHKPQPRVISVHELFPEKETKHKAFFPDVTVLHRCDNSVGCCPSNHLCRPKHSTPLHLPFKVTYLEHMGKHKKGSWVIDYYSLDNHTECECVDASVCVPPTDHQEEGSSHESGHHSESSHHQPDHHSEPNYNSGHQSSSKPDQYGGSSTENTVYIPARTSSASPGSPADPSFYPDGEQESSTLPLLDSNHVLNTTSTSTTEKIDERDISSFFD